MCQSIRSIAADTVNKEEDKRSRAAVNCWVTFLARYRYPAAMVTAMARSTYIQRGFPIITGDMPRAQPTFQPLAPGAMKNY